MSEPVAYWNPEPEPEHIARDLEVHVPAWMLRDPNTARRLAAGLIVLVQHEADHGNEDEARFLAALITSLRHHADELERAYNQIASEVGAHWWAEDEAAVVGDLTGDLDADLDRLLGEGENDE